jgi:aryl carrier-like protein
MQPVILKQLLQPVIEHTPQQLDDDDALLEGGSHVTSL